MAKGESVKSNEQSRREFIKKTAYVAPVILTLRATPASARAGSGVEPRPNARAPMRKPDEEVGNSR